MDNLFETIKNNMIEPEKKYRVYIYNQESTSAMAKVEFYDSYDTAKEAREVVKQLRAENKDAYMRSADDKTI